MYYCAAMIVLFHLEIWNVLLFNNLKKNDVIRKHSPLLPSKCLNTYSTFTFKGGYILSRAMVNLCS